MSDELRASRDAMLALHVPTIVAAIDDECAIGAGCEHEDECPTHPVTACRHCYESGLEASRYAYEDGGLDAVYWPCETVRVAHRHDPRGVEVYFRKQGNEPCTGDEFCTAYGHVVVRQHIEAWS